MTKFYLPLVSLHTQCLQQSSSSSIGTSLAYLGSQRKFEGGSAGTGAQIGRPEFLIQKKIRIYSQLN